MSGSIVTVELRVLIQSVAQVFSQKVDDLPFVSQWLLSMVVVMVGLAICSSSLIKSFTLRGWG
jgi:cell division protein FtsX